jgi:hypothetical protein
VFLKSTLNNTGRDAPETVVAGYPANPKALIIISLVILNRDAPDIRPDNPAFFDIRCPAGYQIALPDIR